MKVYQKIFKLLNQNSPRILILQIITVLRQLVMAQLSRLAALLRMTFRHMQSPEGILQRYLNTEM